MGAGQFSWLPYNRGAAERSEAEGCQGFVYAIRFVGLTPSGSLARTTSPIVGEAWVRSKTSKLVIARRVSLETRRGNLLAVAAFVGTACTHLSVIFAGKNDCSPQGEPKLRCRSSALSLRVGFRKKPDVAISWQLRSLLALPAHNPSVTLR